MDGLRTPPYLPLAFLVLAAVARAASTPGNASEEPPLDVARLLGTVADGVWKDRPEWGDMAVAILKGEMLHPEKSWWRPSQKSLGWPWLASHFDRNGDGRIERTEFPLDDLLFERLDRNQDGAIRAADLEPPRDGQFPGLGEVFSRLDRDSNGRISLEELTEFFKKADSGGLGFLSREDIRRALFESPEEEGDDGKRGGGGGGDIPPPWIMLHMLFTGQIGSLTEGPRLGEMAPDFMLPVHQSKRSVTLSASRGKRPVVLIFGSFT
jgi:EF hand domain-containing protein